MNLVGKPVGNDLLFVDFNQDHTCLSVGTRTGYKMYNCEPFGKCYGRPEGGAGIVEMLFCTSLVAVAGAGEQPPFSPRRLQIMNTKRETEICQLNFVKTILAVRLNRKRLVVFLEDKVHIYDITTMKLMHAVDTPPNPRGIGALSPNSDNNLLAYPASSTVGEVLIFDALNLQAVTIVSAHKTAVSTMAFNFTGTLLATSSDKGTVIRVFSAQDGRQLSQYRRGSYPATIHSISFNLKSTFMCVSSDSDTVHIFKLMSVHNQSADDGKKKSSSGIGAYLPYYLSNMWEPQRSFAYVKLPSSGEQNICAMSNTSAQVMVVSSSGFVFVYDIPVEGGECKFSKQYSLL